MRFSTTSAGGNTERPETLGSLVRAALACHDVAVAWKTPFISGKDSLNNEFSWVDASGQKQTIVIPSTLLISAMGQVADVSKCVTMDLKQSGNLLYLVGATQNEFGGSHLLLHLKQSGGAVPTVDLPRAKHTFTKVHSAILAGLVRACHDLSEGGLAVALAEMAFAGQLGLDVDIASAAIAAGLSAAELLFSESNSRFVIEVPAGRESDFENQLSGVDCVRLGTVSSGANCAVRHRQETLIDKGWQELFNAWHKPLDWA
ncbi:MAG: AIR synthase-related protein [Pirellulales bacterium]